MNDTEKPVIINGVPVYDTDNYVPGQTKRKTTKNNIFKKITTTPEKIFEQNENEKIETSSHTSTEKKYGNTSITCGLLSLLFMRSFGLNIPFAIIAIIYGKKTKNTGDQLYGTIGKIAGIISLTVTVISVFATIINLYLQPS